MLGWILDETLPDHCAVLRSLLSLTRSYRRRNPPTAYEEQGERQPDIAGTVL
jgi:hypothetical protein